MILCDRESYRLRYVRIFDAAILKEFHIDAYKIPFDAVLKKHAVKYSEIMLRNLMHIFE